MRNEAGEDHLPAKVIEGTWYILEMIAQREVGEKKGLPEDQKRREKESGWR